MTQLKPCSAARSKRLRSASGRWRTSLAHIIGTSVSDTTAEMTMVTDRVMANSWNSRPTTSPMNSSGISTAISDTVSDMMVKPICSEPFSAAASGASPASTIAGDVLDHDDGVVDHEAGRDGQCHQRQIVQAEPQQVHHRQRADQRQRHRQAGDDGRRQVAQEQEDHQHDQHDREAELELHVGDRGADRRGAVGQHRDVDRRGQAWRSVAAAAP